MLAKLALKNIRKSLKDYAIYWDCSSSMRRDF